MFVAMTWVLNSCQDNYYACIFVAAVTFQHIKEKCAAELFFIANFRHAKAEIVKPGLSFQSVTMATH